MQVDPRIAWHALSEYSENLPRIENIPTAEGASQIASPTRPHFSCLRCRSRRASLLSGLMRQAQRGRWRIVLPVLECAARKRYRRKRIPGPGGSCRQPVRCAQAFPEYRPEAAEKRDCGGSLRRVV